MSIDRNALDRYITGDYGEQQFDGGDEDDWELRMEEDEQTATSLRTWETDILRSLRTKERARQVDALRQANYHYRRVQMIEQELARRQGK